ncbi:PEP-CTERM sorting domain-containing protein [Chamaesiphon sp. VAR_48_metabat_403]|uniref:PEP-CTERM sorting domain-containing protein n=1 Tax=Chamaesiphon sp. VAR_48_metabat_403 TaxID=2964700 RepID=UPI00286E21F2|nr:PEP-CTERM sorting domain-containing protein [Chamaesiphon sp. VAR_48_metabat_403]
MNLKHFLRISGLAIVFATAIYAAPAGAVVLAPGSQLRFDGDVTNTLGTIDANTVGNIFEGSFTRGSGGGGTVSTASGTFASLLAGVGPNPTATGIKFISSNPVSFKQVGFSVTIPGGIDYIPTTDLVFTFPNTNGTSTDPAGGTLTLPATTRFLVTPAPSTGGGSGVPAVARSTFDIYTTPSFDGIFTNGTDSTVVNFTSFSFEVDNIDNTNLTLNPSPNGSFSVVATVPGATTVPEPFTIIGTLLGGTAAMRMRKKLAAAANH